MASPSPSQPFGFGQPSSGGSLSMGSLGLQQSQRSLSSQQQFPTRLSASGGHIPGHVTPTNSGMANFPTSLPNSLPPQPHSPNSLLSMSSRGLPSRQQLLPEAKRLMGIGMPVGGMERLDMSLTKGALPTPRGGMSLGAMSTFGLSHSSRGFSHGLMGSGMQNNSYSSNPALDLSEFPSLSNRVQQENSSTPNLQSNPMAGRPPYGPSLSSNDHEVVSFLRTLPASSTGVKIVKPPSSSQRRFQPANQSIFPGIDYDEDLGLSSCNIFGMVKQPTSESNEFQIHNEDFPALPGSQNQDLSQDFNKSGLTENKDGMRFPGDKVQGHKRGIQTTKDGRVTNIPPGMVTDQFGMVGLLTFIRVAESDPNLVSLALGSDLTTLGLNLNSPENLYPTFGGPWADHPCRPQDIDYPVPSEYLINQSIRDKLAPLKLNRYGEDLLFFLFYMYTGDILQLASAIELYNREWRFHKDERVWITRAPGMGPTEKTNTYERGTYYFFDVVNWRKVAKEFHLDYERLEERPTMPNFSVINI